MTQKADKKARYKEYKQIDFPAFEKEVLQFWKENRIFEKSIENRSGQEAFIFYEGPPSANGLPGIHHVISRAIKDVFCRYKTLKGYSVKRKAGWDTHGLPIELQVEKKMGITKDDIGKKISVEDYNKDCRQDVLQFKDNWDDLTERIGFWVDLEHPYITYENNYIETCWYLLRKLYDKGLLYKGYTIQPYSPAAGTGLSSHELNQPGTYQMVKDTTAVAQFKLTQPEKLGMGNAASDTFFLAWTTTPWTLPSNTALAVGNKINYAVIDTFNAYTYKPIRVILAEDLVHDYFQGEQSDMGDYKPGDKRIPYQWVGIRTGKQLVGLKYEQLLPYVKPEGKAFEVVAGDFVSTEDGTGIVHLAPSFGSDDFRMAQKYGLASLTLVDKQGKFVDGMGEFSGMFVKNYNNQDESDPNYKSADVLIAIKLKEENKAFKIEKYEHSYPHCWRTDKPILYYPLESWFIKTTTVKDRLVALNKTINWKPKSTGEGRFGNWLENLVDWNLSRSRYWGTPLPIWRTEDGSEEICIGSVAELKAEIEKSMAAGYMLESQFLGKEFDLHRPFIDDVVLVSKSGKKMIRETDLIDVWFDSGAMPYAQVHYPFENKDDIDNNQNFPADFIAEGVDQTRGWFFTLHTLAVMLFDSVAYKNVLANGLVLDKNGNKMSKRLGNTVEPFSTIDKYGADAVRWYMLSNTNPWDNLKFDMESLQDSQRKQFSTLYNIYSFFALYANIDAFDFSEKYIPVKQRPEIDRWILSLLNSLIKVVDESMDDYEPTKATRAIQTFTTDHLSNWYVRLCRRRFWKGEYSEDKISAYQTLYECLETLSRLMSSFSPFYSDQIFRDLNTVSGRIKAESVHLSDFPVSNKVVIDKHLEHKMRMAQEISSMILGIRKKLNIKVRQPLSKILIPVMNATKTKMIREMEPIILSEVNVKEIQYLTEKDGEVMVKSAKPDFKKLGPRVGSLMKELKQAVEGFSSADIRHLEEKGKLEVKLRNNPFVLNLDEVEIVSKDMPGWQVASESGLTVALDINITAELALEGNARELVNRIQNLRKEMDFEVTDRINVNVENHDEIRETIERFNDYICGEILAASLETAENKEFETRIEINGSSLGITIKKS
jgi:isoleucyl-tRNA synthetase